MRSSAIARVSHLLPDAGRDRDCLPKIASEERRKLKTSKLEGQAGLR